MTEEFEFLNMGLPEVRTPVAEITFTAPSLPAVCSTFRETLNVSKFYQPAIDLKVENEESAKTALAMACQLKKLKNGLEESRKNILKPHLEYQREINGAVSDFSVQLDHLMNLLKVKIDGWIDSERDNPFLSVEKIAVQDGSLSTKEKWLYSIERESDLPTEYLCPDEDYIQDQIANGVRNIPGVKIWCEKQTSMRVKN